MKVAVEVEGLRQAQATLDGMSERRLAAVMATTLTRTAKRLSGQWQQEIDERIDRPTARTRSATTFRGATASRLEATVIVKDRVAGTPPSEYLQPQESGGRRRVKKFELALRNAGALPPGYITVPGRAAALDAHGNVSRSQIIAVIAQIGRDFSPGYQRVISKSTARRLAAQSRHGRKYIAVPPADAARLRIDAGIYEAQRDRALKAVFLFKRAATYHQRLHLIEQAQRSAQALVGEEFVRAAGESMARMRAAAAGRK